MEKDKKQMLHNMYNATSTDDGTGNDELETYENWLERQLLSRIEKIEQLNLHNVSNSFVYIVEDARTHNAMSYLSSYEKAQEEIVRLKAQGRKLHINTQKIY